MTPLTISKHKTAVLLRLPDGAVEILDGMAKAAARAKCNRGRTISRTTIIYRLLAKHPRLAKRMEGLV